MNKKILFIMLIICLTSMNIAVAQDEQTENIMYKTYDGRWIIESELEKGTSNYPYLIEDMGDNWKYTTDGNSVFIPKTFNIIEQPMKISPCLTYSKTTLANNMINHNETVSYLVFPYSLSNAKTWSNENNIKFGSWLFQAGDEHISIYDESGKYLNPEYYEFKIVNDEIRLYFVNSEANSLTGNITFEMHSWILDGYTSFANSGQYYIDYDLSNLWINDSIEAGVENVYIAEKTGSYSPDGAAVFDFYDNSSILITSKYDTVGGTWDTVTDGDTSPVRHRIDGGDAFGSDNTAGTIIGNVYDDFILESRIKQDSTGPSTYWAGLQFRYTDNNNRYYTYIDINGDVKLEETVSGTGTTLAVHTASYNDGQWHDMEIICIGNSIKVYVDDTLCIDVTDSSLSSGDAGFFNYANGEHNPKYDNVIVRNVPIDEPSVVIIDKTTYYEIHINSTIELIDYQIAINGTELGITNYNESWNIYQSLILEVENLIATPYIESALIEWDTIQFADYYNVYRIEPSILFTNETMVLDGILDNAYSDIGQRGLLRTPNSEYLNQFDTIYSLINDTHVFMYANAHDDDISSVDDSIHVYFDPEQNGLTIDDRGYIIKENEQIIYQKWSGSQWISGGVTAAEGVVLGAGTNNTDYELFFPLYEVPELDFNRTIDMVVMHESTSISTVQSYFPQEAFSIENTTGWQNMYIENSSMAADVFLFNTTNNMFNLTGLSAISWYRVGVSAVYNITESNITYVEFITQQYPEYYIDGYVIDLNTSVGIHNALVTVTDTFTSGFKLTDATGYYKFNGLRNDYYTLEASAVGYTTGSTNVTINNTDVTADNIYLKFISYTMEEIYNKIEETNNNLESKILNLETTINHLKTFILMSAMIVIGALYNDKRKR